MSIYALSQRCEETCDAAGKAMRDVFAVLAEKGSKIIWSMPKSSSKYLKILDLPYLSCFLLFCAGKNDTVFYSIPENHIKIRLVKKFQKLKKYRILCFINDLNAFRYGNLDAPDVQARMKQEAEMIGLSDTVLIPNGNTASLLREQGITSRLVPVGIWDYRMTKEQAEALNGGNAVQEKQGAAVIAFAGNLNKSEFLQKMESGGADGITFELWGKLEEEGKKKLPAFCHYNGVLPAEEVPQAVSSCSYGLVWDGSGSDGIEGGLGEYLRYNNSHKCGLYLASGLPAIVWEHSGMAGFIREHQCGLTIRGLGELPEKIAGADYSFLKTNAEAVAGKLQKGYYLSKALDIALKS